MGRVALVSCGSKKQDRPCRARDLYNGILFTKHRKWADAFTDDMYVLSAKYGLIHATKTIEPYNLTLNRMKRADKARWGRYVADQITARIPPGDTLVFLAGKPYYENIIKHLNHTYEIPFEGLRLGYRYQTIDKHVANGHT